MLGAVPSFLLPQKRRTEMSTTNLKFRVRGAAYTPTAQWSCPWYCCSQGWQAQRRTVSLFIILGAPTTFPLVLQLFVGVSCIYHHNHTRSESLLEIRDHVINFLPWKWQKQLQYILDIQQMSKLKWTQRRHELRLKFSWFFFIDTWWSFDILSTLMVYL